MEKHYAKEAGPAAGSAGIPSHGGPGGAYADDAGDMCLRALDVRAVREEGGSRSIRVVASTPAIDSYGEIVEQSWILDRFNANPVILWAHMSRELPIGKATDVGLVDGNLEMTINFVDEKANPMAPRVFEQYRQGAMRAVSVGFYPRDVRVEMRDGKEVYVLANNILLECSCTPIGANPEALSKSHQRIRQRAERGAPQTTAAERGTENTMDEKTKAALDAAMKAEREATEKKLADDEKRVKDAEERAARTEAANKRLTTSLVKALVECGRFSKDELDEQTELASKDLDLFEKLAAKRAIRGTEIVNAKALPGGDGPEREKDGGSPPVDLMADAASAAGKE